MYILGFTISYHDAAACLMHNGELINFIEEERLTRVKGSPKSFPIKSTLACLKRANITLSQVDYIAVGLNLEKYDYKMQEFYKHLDSKYEKDMITKISEKMILEDRDKERVLYRIKQDFMKEGVTDELPPFIFVDHHLSHAASSFYCSGFEKSLIITIDGSGEEICTAIWEGNEREIRLIDLYNIPNSLGWFYSCITEYLGFKDNQQEGTVMGLAAYGKDDKYIRQVLEKILSVDKKGYSINPYYIFYGQHSFGKRFTDKLVNELGQPRVRNSIVTDKHKNIAYIAQNILEEAVKMLVTKYIDMTGLHNICLAGGVAMNCKLNGEIVKMPQVDKLFIQPASYDAGTSLGAAMVVSDKNGFDPRFKMEHTYWGIEYSNNEIEQELKIAKVRYKYIENPSLIAAKYLSQGSIIGWFQGAMELGARSLGARSILANPSESSMKDKLNNQVKFREYWRPFAPSMTNINYNKIFDTKHLSSFMLLALTVKDEYIDKIPAVVHIDKTARPQIVEEKYNKKYWELLNNFFELTSIPCVLNTSFNIKGEPIVCTVHDALRCFYSTGLDALFIGDFLLEK